MTRGEPGSGNDDERSTPGSRPPSAAVPRWEPAEDLEAPHPGWTRLPPRDHVGVGRSFVLGDPDGQRLRVRGFLRDEDQALVGRAWFGPLAEGPPKHVHGGCIAALLDEAMGAAGWLAGHRVVAAKISVDFKRPVPLGTVATFVTQIVRVEGRRVYARAELRFADGVVAAESEGLFIVMDIDKLKAALTG